MGITYQGAESPLDEALISEILDLAGRVFDPINASDIRWRLAQMPTLTVFSARWNNVLCGFKIGYAVTSRRYYSWLGGVDPEHRIMPCSS